MVVRRMVTLPHQACVITWTLRSFELCIIALIAMVAQGGLFGKLLKWGVTPQIPIQHSRRVQLQSAGVVPVQFAQPAQPT